MSDFLKSRTPVPLYLPSAPRPLEVEEGVEPEGEEVGFTDAFSSAFQTVNTIRGVGGAVTEANFETDHNFRLDLNEKLKDVPENHQPFMAEMLQDARSDEHADWLLARAGDEFESLEEVQQYTGGSIWGNLGLFGLASIADPVNLATLMLAAPLSAAKHMEKYSRVRRAAKVAGFEASVNAALEVPLVAGNPTAEPTDILWAAMFGGVIGGGIGAIAHKAKPGTLAKKQADKLINVANESLDDMARAEAHTIANREHELNLQPPEELYDMALDVRRDPTQKATRESYEPTETINAQRAKAEQDLETMSGKELPDEPVPVRGADAATDMLDELAFIKSVQRGDVELSVVERTRADAEFQKAKRQFVADFRAANPDKAKEIFGASRNPTMADVEAAIPRIKKLLAASEKKAAKAKKDYEAALEKRGVEKDVLIDRIAELDAKLAARAAAGPDLGHSVGAAQAEKGGIDLSKISDEEFDEIYNIPEARQQRIPGTEKATRFDMAGVVDRSPNQAMRVAGSKIFQDAQPKVGHTVNPESASELAEWMRDVTLGIYDAVAKPAYKAWMKEQGYANGILARALDWNGKMRSAFEEEVMVAVQEGTHASKHVMDAAGAQADAYKRAFDYAVANKLPGFEDIKYDKNYTPRRTSHQKVMHLNSDYAIDMKGNAADSALGELYYRAMMEANPSYDPALTLRIANKIAKREIQRATSVSYDMPDFGAMTREKLDELFDAIDMTDVDRQNFFDGLDQQFAQKDAGAVSHAKKRMDLEVHHTPLEATYTGSSIPGGVQTGDRVALTLNDMMETRGDILLHGYVNDLVGWGSLNKVTNGKVHNPSSLKKWMEEINEYEQTFVMDPARRERRGVRGSALEGELKYLSIGINHTLGRAVDPGGDIAAGARRFINGWNFMRVMNQTIFPQMSESSKIVTSTSLETALHYMPAMKDWMNALRTGAELSPAQQKLSMAAREIGLGTNVVRGGVVTRYQTDLDGSLFTKADKSAARMAHLKKVTARPLQASMDYQEVLTSTSLQAEMAMRAKGLKQTSEGDLKRLAWMGIDKAHLKRIDKQIMKYALDEKGQPYSSSSSKWIGDLQMDKWDDAVARDKFGFGLKRRVGEIIQTNNIGNLPRFAVDDIGAMLVQFRTFPIAAWNKQLMHHLSYNDANTYLTFALNSAFASGFYALQKSMASVGREDAQEYRDKALTPKNLAFAAWERSAWGTMTPAIGDAVSMVAQGQVMNPYSTRTTGLGKLTAGIPGIDLIEKGAKAFSSTTGLLHEDRNFKKAFKDAYAMMPFYNFLGLQNSANAFASVLPDDK